MDALVSLTIDEGVAFVTLDRANKLNAITIELRDQLLDVLAHINDNPDVRCVVLRANGKAFCTGQDLGERTSIIEGTPIDLGAALEEGMNRVILALTHLPQPTIAAVQGTAVGAGASLAIACDIVLASKSAAFHFSFLRLGLVPDSGASWLLPRKVGMARAAAILLSAAPISSEQAMAWGMVTVLDEDTDALDERTSDMARTIASRDPRATRDTKRLLLEGAHCDLSHQLHAEARAQTRAGHSSAYRNALTRFFGRDR